MAILLLAFGFGTACVAATRGRAAASTATPGLPSPGFSAVPNFSSSCHVCCSTVAAFPPRRLSMAPVKAGFRRLCGTIRPSDFCWVIDSFVLSFFGLPSLRSEPSRSLWVRLPDFVTITSPLQRESRRILGFAARGRLTRPTLPYGASLSLRRLRTYDFHSASPRGPPALAQKEGLQQEGPGFPSQRPCLFGVGFPPSGPREDLHLLSKSHARRNPGFVADAVGKSPGLPMRGAHTSGSPSPLCGPGDLIVESIERAEATTP